MSMTIATRRDPDHDRLRRLAAEPDDEVGSLEGSVPAEPAIWTERKGRSVHRDGRGTIAPVLEDQGRIHERRFRAGSDLDRGRVGLVAFLCDHVSLLRGIVAGAP